MYKVFIENTPIYFEKGEESFPMVLKKYLPVLRTNNYEKLLNTVFTNSNFKLSLISPDPKQCLKLFFREFKSINAAGGLVFHPKKEAFLFIKRDGKWDLPKGKVEKNETLENAAIREVEEECGITNLTLKNHLITTYHTFYKYNKYVLKSSDWFYMECFGDEKPVPQTEEGITEVKWVKKEDFSVIMKNTYGNIIDVLDSI